MIKAYFISLGCPKNLVDSERIMGALNKNGIMISSNLEDSDIVVINTCGFIGPALKETESEIRRLVRLEKKVYVYGCAVNRSREILIKKFPEVEGWYYIDEKNKLLKDITKKK